MYDLWLQQVKWRIVQLNLKVVVKYKGTLTKIFKILRGLRLMPQSFWVSKIVWGFSKLFWGLALGSDSSLYVKLQKGLGSN